MKTDKHKTKWKIKNKMYENYGDLKLSDKELDIAAADPDKRFFENKFTYNEHIWAEKFDCIEMSIEQGKVLDAVVFMTDLKGSELTETNLKQLYEWRMVKQGTTASQAEATIRAARKRDNYKGIRKPKSSMYDAYDHIQHAGTILVKDESDEGEEIERGIATNPEENLAEAIHESQVKKCSLERLVQDYKLSKIAKAELLAKTQTMTYEAMTYTFHGTQYMNLNYVLKGANGRLYVQDQHDRIQALDLYLKRATSDSYATHAEVWYPGQVGQTWIFQAGAKSNIEGKAVQYEVR